MANAQMRYHYHYTQEYLDSLDDNTWAMYWQDLQWIRKKEKGD